MAPAHRAGRLARWCLRLVAGVALALGGPLAAAACIGDGPAELAPLEALAFRDPTAAIQQARAQLLAPTATPSPARQAALWAIAAEAYRVTGQGRAALDAAQSGLAALGDKADAPLRVRLHIAHALALQATKAQKQGIAELDDTLATVQPGTKAAACILKDRGWLLYDLGDIERGLLDLTVAHDLLQRLGDAPQRMVTAGRLAAVYSTAREFDQAARLLEETIAYFRSVGAQARLATAFDRLGRAHWGRGDLPAAEEAFEQMHFSALRVGDPVAAAYAQLRLCGVHIDEGLVAAADRHCRAAMQGLEGQRAFDAEEARILRAYRGRIALAAARPADAVTEFDAALAGNVAELSRDLRAQVHLWRSEALSALGRHADAHADLQEYLERLRILNAAQTASQIAVLRVRFATDREVEKVAELARDNAAQRQQFEAERRRLERAQTLRQLLSAIVVIALLLLAALGLLLRRDLRLRRELRELADRDDLTALPNRRRILDLAGAALRTSRASGEPMALALVDLDHFKGINDRHGHACGDAVLRQFASAARAALRPGDAVGRYGGEEFLVVLPGTDVVAARAVIERMRESMRRLIDVEVPGGQRIGVAVTLSAGLAAARLGDSSVEDLVRRADLALYRAKESGRDRIEILPMPA